MIYCPHCQRPTARESGECPHCGKSLDEGDSDRSSKSTQGPQPSASGESSAVQLDDDALAKDASSSSGDGDGSATIEASSEYEPPPDGVRASGLELAISPSYEASGAPLPQAAVVEEVGVIEKLAGFSEPDSGPVGAVRYFFAVKKRIKELDAEHREETKAAAEALERRRQKIVELGRLVHTEKLTVPNIETQLNRALVAEGELQGGLRQREGLQRSYEARRKQFEKDLEKAREGLKPFRDRVTQAQKKLAEAEKKQKGVAVQKKRIDIELRNRDELIAKLQKEQEAATEGEAREKILAEIKTLQEDRSVIRLKQDGLDVALDEAEHVCHKLRDELSDVEEEFKREKADEEAVAKKITTLEQSFVDRNKKVAGQVEADKAKAEAAWVVVAEEVLAARISAPSVDPLVEEVGKEKNLASEHAARAERLEHARSSYQKEAYDKGKRNLIFAGAAAALLVVGVAVLLALL